MESYIVSSKSTRFRAPGLFPENQGEPGVTDRQERIPGFRQSQRTHLKLLLIGGGGIGSEVGVSEARKGVKELVIIDPDTIDLTNLNRQRFFRADLYKNKAECLARNLVRECTSQTLLTAYPATFQEAMGNGHKIEADVVICGVDNNETRVAVAKHFLNRVPVIFVAVSEDADHGYVFIQEPGKACYGCLFPNAAEDALYHPCSPAIIDILKLVAGIATYAVDTLLMSRIRNWDYKEIFLSGSIPERNARIPRKTDCPICGLKDKLRKDEENDDHHDGASNAGTRLCSVLVG